MMNKILLLTLMLTPTVWAQNTSEEAIILNQELQFLEDSANNVTTQARLDLDPQQRARPIDTNSLEQQYFGDESTDAIQSRTAAPRRRQLD